MHYQKLGKLYRADFVLMGSLEKREGKVLLQFHCMVRGAMGMTNISDNVPATTQLNKVFEVRSMEGTHKLEQKVAIGRFHGKVLEVEVE